MALIMQAAAANSHRVAIHQATPVTRLKTFNEAAELLDVTILWDHSKMGENGCAVWN